MIEIILIISSLSTRSIAEKEDDRYLQIDFLLFKLDNVIDDGLKAIPDDLIHKCQLALIRWTIDGHEDNNYPPSTSEDHANADRLIDKIREIHLALGGDEHDREGFVRDAFTLEQQWVVAAVQYYSFIDYYDLPVNSFHIFKLIQWNIYSIDDIDSFVPEYHLERGGTDELGYNYFLGRRLYPHYHETLINFGDYCPSYMELKTLIIGDITGEMPLDALTASGSFD